MRRLLVFIAFVGSCVAQQVNSDIIPASSGLNIGHINQRWNGFFTNLNIQGSCTYNGSSCFGAGGNVFNGIGFGPSWQDVASIPTPPNPATGLFRLYINNGTGLFTCLTHTGGNCAPTGGGSMTWPATAGVANYSGAFSWGTSYTVGTAANNLVQLTGSALLPSGIFPTLNQNTTGTAGGLLGCAVVNQGDLCYWTGSGFAAFAANTSGTASLQENASGVLSWGSGAATTFQTNGTPLSSATTVNFLNSASFNGLTGTFTNTSAGNIQFGFSGTLGNSGLTNSSMSFSCTAPLNCTSSVSLGGTMTGSVSSATTGALGVIKLAQDLGGTALLPTVIGLHFGTTGIATESTAPTTGQCLYYDGTGITGVGCGGATINNAPQYSATYYSASGTTNTQSGLSPPTTNGVYFVGYNVVSSAAVAPTDMQAGIGGRSITGSATTDTVLFSDVNTIIDHDQGASGTVSETLPTATTLTNTKFAYRYCNHSPQNDTITPTTWTIQVGKTAPGSSLTVLSGQCYTIKVDPNSSTQWLADGTALSLAGTAGYGNFGTGTSSNYKPDCVDASSVAGADAGLRAQTAEAAINGNSSPCVTSRAEIGTTISTSVSPILPTFSGRWLAPAGAWQQNNYSTILPGSVEIEGVSIGTNSANGSLLQALQGSWNPGLGANYGAGTPASPPAYSAGATYYWGDAVSSSGTNYYAIADGINAVTPGSDWTKWTLLANVPSPVVQPLASPSGTPGSKNSIQNSRLHNITLDLQYIAGANTMTDGGICFNNLSGQELMTLDAVMCRNPTVFGINMQDFVPNFGPASGQVVYSAPSGTTNDQAACKVSNGDATNHGSQSATITSISVSGTTATMTLSGAPAFTVWAPGFVDIMNSSAAFSPYASTVVDELGNTHGFWQLNSSESTTVYTFSVLSGTAACVSSCGTAYFFPVGINTNSNNKQNDRGFDGWTLNASNCPQSAHNGAYSNYPPLGWQASSGNVPIRNIHIEGYRIPICVGCFAASDGQQIINAWPNVNTHTGVLVSNQFGTPTNLDIEGLRCNISGGGNTSAMVNCLVDIGNGNTLTLANNPVITYRTDGNGYPYILAKTCSEVTKGFCMDGTTGSGYYASGVLVQKVNPTTGATSVGVDNSVAGLLTLSNGSASAHTIFGSAATTTNTILGFAAVPTTGHVVDCTVSSTTCTLHDSGLVTANVLQSGGALGTPSSGTLTNATGYLENQLTGAAAAGTITEGGSTFSVTRAGVSTANLTAPWVFQNTNSTNNNSSMAVIFSTPGTSTGQVTGYFNGATTGAALIKAGTGGTVSSGAISGQTDVFVVQPTGYTAFGTDPAVTAGTGGGWAATEGTGVTGKSSTGEMWADSANHNIRWNSNNATTQGLPVSIMLTSQYTNSTTGFTNVTGTNSLAFAAAASTNYTMTCTLYYQAASTGGLNIEFTGPASPTNITYSLVDPGSATALVQAAVATAYSTSLGAAVTTATTNFPATVTLSLQNGTNAGTVQMLAKSSAAVQLQIQNGSFCTWQSQ